MKEYPLAEVSFRAGYGDVAAGCSGPGCTVAEVATEPLVALAAVVVSVAFFFAFAYVRDARETCTTERQQARTELDSFGRFVDRVSSLDAGGTALSTTGATQSIAGMTHDDRLDSVRDAYRDTVMDVPHYDEEYDDSLPESMAEEFGPDVATAVCRGDTLSAQLQRTLVARSTSAGARREKLDEAIQTELNAMEEAAADLERLDRERQTLLEHVDETDRFDACVDVWRRLDDVEARIADVVSERQEQLQNPPMNTGDDLPSFYDYLYDRLDVTYPVLATAAELVEQVRDDRKRVYQSLTGNAA